LKLRVGKNAGQSENAGSERTRAHCGKEQRVNCISADREIARSVPPSDWKLSNRSSAPWWNERPVGRIDSRRSPGRSATAEQLVIANVELTQEPIEPEFLQIVLVDLDEFRFDLDLFGSGDTRLFYDCV